MVTNEERESCRDAVGSRSRTAVPKKEVLEDTSIEAVEEEDDRRRALLNETKLDPDRRKATLHNSNRRSTGLLHLRWCAVVNIVGAVDECLYCGRGLYQSIPARRLNCCRAALENTIPLHACLGQHWGAVPDQPKQQRAGKALRFFCSKRHQNLPFVHFCTSNNSADDRSVNYLCS